MAPRYSPNDEPADGGDTDERTWPRTNRVPQLLAATVAVLAVVVVLGSGTRRRRRNRTQE